jgi:exopolysaccharide biosynthesis predicted pyruvyltransferase EpsI
MRQILPYSAYEPIFEKYSGKKAALVQGEGNVGDRLIQQATFQLFSYFGIERVMYGADVIFWGGGGNMGECHGKKSQQRYQLSLIAERDKIPFEILPQSWMAPEINVADRVFAREQVSIHRHEPNAIHMPDLALCYIPAFDCKFEPTHEICYAMREDEERVKGELLSVPTFDPAHIARTVEEYFRFAIKYKRIVTNRLHFAIIGLILERDVTLTPNSYHKNEAVWTDWLHQYGCKFEERLC